MAQSSRFFAKKSDEEPLPNFEDSLLELESDALYGLGSKQSDLSFFARQLEDGRLNLFPAYQRSYVWQQNKASRLIVTALCNRFIPPLVLHEKSKGIFDVVDGKQRLTSLLGFYLNRRSAQLPPEPAKSKLVKILPRLAVLSKLDESYESLNGLSFDDLSLERQRAFESFTVSYMVIPKHTPSTDVFEVYEDINSGGEDLTAQQIRRAVYHGPYMKMIDCLKETCVDFHAIRSPKTPCELYEPCKKDSDGELILRAFAFRNCGDRFKMPIKSFLNRELDGSADIDNLEGDDKRRVQAMVEENQVEFTSVMRIARLVFGDDAFRKKKKVISNTMWDATYSAIAELMANYKEIDFTRAKDNIAAAIVDSIEGGFFSMDDERTTASKFERRKHEIKTLIRSAIESGETRDPQRNFPSEWRKLLCQDQVGLCALCHQTIDESRIEEGTYVHIDHIKPHSMGGKTVYDNAQLVHRACNLHKSANVS